MYRIYDKAAAITEVQTFLRIIGNPDIFVSPTGVFDENTALSVKDYQERRNLLPTGMVDKETFDLMYAEYITENERDEAEIKLLSFISFPLLPGKTSDGMIHLNKMMSELLDYYGITHTLRVNSFYSKQTADAVRQLRKIYLLDDFEFIDEAFYIRMVRDHNSINHAGNYFK